MIFNKRTGIIALILLVLSPIHIYYSQDANYYSWMMGLTVLSLYFMFLFIRRFNPVWLIPYGLSAYLNYYVHPSNLLLIGCQLLVIGCYVVFSPVLHEKARNILKRVSESKPLFIGSTLVTGGGLLVVLYFFFRFVYKKAMHSYGRVVAENLEFTPGFFMKLAMDYGVAFQQYTSVVFAVTAIFLIIFAIGFIISLRDKKYFALYVLFSWTLPFIAIYIKKISHFFHVRYTSFIVPGFLLMGAYGIDRLANMAKNRFGDKARNGVIALILAVLAVGILPNLGRYYTGQKQGWKGAVDYLKENMQEGEKVTSFLHANDDALEFYYDYFDMDKSSLVKLSGEFRGNEYSAFYRLKKMCFTEPGVYFATSYTRYEDPRIWEWVKKYFEVVYNQPSLHQDEFNREGKEVILYRFRFPG